MRTSSTPSLAAASRVVTRPMPPAPPMMAMFMRVLPRGLRDVRPSAASSSSAVRARPAIGTRSATCSGVRALAIGATTAGSAASQASETAATVVECVSAISSSAASSATPRSSRNGTASSARSLSTSAPGRYLPVRKPFASAKYGTQPIPSRTHRSASSPRYSPRSTRLWCGCSATYRGSPSASLAASASASRGAVKFEAPMYRTLPAATSSPNAASVSSIGVSGSSSCA